MRANKDSFFDDLYMNLAFGLAKRSHCLRQKVGAVLAKEHRIISVGYNGPPANTHNCDEDFVQEGGCPTTRTGGCHLAIHAEQNAILYAIKNKTPSLVDAVLYVTLSPCLPCARMVLSMGIKRLLYAESYAKYKGLKEEEGLEFLKTYQVQVEHWTGKRTH